MCVPGQRDMEVKHLSILAYSTNSEVTGLLDVSVWKQQLLEFSGCFFPRSVIFCLGCIKILRSWRFLNNFKRILWAWVELEISADEEADYKLLGFWNHLYTSELPLKYCPFCYFLSSVVVVSEDWHFQMLLDLYIAEVFHALTQLIQIRAVVPVRSCRRRLEKVQCESSTYVPVTPDVTAWQWLCSLRGSPEPFCMLTANISSWLLLW